MSEALSDWTRRDLDILEALTLRVRMLTAGHIARCWWGEGDVQRSNANHRLRKMRKAGLLHRYQIEVHPPLRIERPLAVWLPGQQAPDIETIAISHKRRWTNKLVQLGVYVATPLAANLFGSFGGRLSKRIHRTHDLHCGLVYVWFRRHAPQLAQRLYGEDAYRKAGFRKCDPDSFIVDERGNREGVVEFVGSSYGPRRLWDLHEHCENEGWGYSLW